jgi:predicted ATPase
VALLWVLQSSSSLLLLEEPELSLNDGIVRKIPRLLKAALRGQKHGRQLLISTHSDALLSNPGIDGRGILLLEPGNEGSTARSPDERELLALKSGLSPAEVMLPKTRPASADQLDLF